MGEIGEGCGNACRGSNYVTRGDDYAGAAFQLNWLVVVQASSTDLRALQILQDADGSVFFFGSATEALDIAGVVFVRAVGKIQPCYVHTETKQIAHRGFGVAGRADGADDFGTAWAGLCRERDGGRNSLRAGKVVRREIRFAWVHRLGEQRLSYRNTYCNCSGRLKLREWQRTMQSYLFVISVKEN